LDRLSGLKPDDAVWTVRLCLVNRGLSKAVGNEDLARIFGSVLGRLAGERHINLLFPYDVTEVAIKLRRLNIEGNKENGALLIELTAPQFPMLLHVLEQAAFTTFYAFTNEMRPPPRNPSLLFENLDAICFAAVFTLYDDAIEVLSKAVKAEEIIDVVRDVAAGLGIPVSD
jgi:hypothetical protein